MAGKFKKLLSSLLAVALVFCGLPITAGAADVGTSDVLEKGNNLTGTEVYFGSYNSSVPGGSIGPILWHVVAKEGNTATLWTTTSMGKMAYDSSNSHKNWSGSEICGWLNGTFLNAAFQSAEKSAINSEYGTAEEPYGEGELWTGKIDSRQKIVLPSVAEIGAGTDTGTWGIPYNNGNNPNRSFDDYWWLRSPGNNSDSAAFVLDIGNVYADGNPVHNFSAIRPAFKLNLESVIFTSAALGGKSANVGDLEQATAPTGAVKLTVLDTTLAPNFYAELDKNTAKPGEDVTVTFSGAVTDTNKFVSCVIVNSSGKITHYGKLSDQDSGTAIFTVPTLAGGDYTIRLFNEECNGDKLTDFCSAPVDIPLKVEGDTPTPTPPTPTPSTSTRRRSSGSGQTYSPPAAAIPTNFVVDAPKAKSALDEKGKSGAAKARIRHNGEIKVLQEAWKAFGKTPVDFDTADENGVQVRVTVPEPGKMTGDKLLSGYIRGSAAENRKAHFEKWFKNKLRVIHLDQAEPWGQPVEIAAKLDLTGMDAGNLYFYSYDSKTNKYKRIENPAYRIDEKGFLHFTTEYAGDIIISDGPLERV